MTIENGYISLEMKFVECAEKLGWSPGDEDLLIVKPIINAALEAKLEIYQNTKSIGDRVKNRIILGIPSWGNSNRNTPLLYIKRSKGRTSFSWNSSHPKYSPYKNSSEKKVFSVWGKENSKIYAQKILAAAQDYGHDPDTRFDGFANNSKTSKLAESRNKTAILVDVLDSPEDWIQAQTARDGPNCAHRQYFRDNQQKYYLLHQLSQLCIQSFEGTIKPRIGATRGHPWWSTDKWTAPTGCIYLFCEKEGIKVHLALPSDKAKKLLSEFADVFKSVPHPRTLGRQETTQTGEVVCEISYSEFDLGLGLVVRGLKYADLWDVGSNENASSFGNIFRDANEPQLSRWRQVNREERVRDPRVVARVLDLAQGKCALCLMRRKKMKDTGAHNPDARFRTESRGGYLEVHHIEGLAIGGEDSGKNCVALHADCHAEAHYSEKKQREQIRELLKESKSKNCG